MIKKYFTLAWRTLIQNKTYSFLNLFGLTIGLTASMLILLFVHQELGYDRFYPDADRIYRTAMDFNTGGRATPTAITMTPLGPTAADRFPEVESYSRVGKTWMAQLFKWGDKEFYETHLMLADTGFFETFGYQLLAGDPESALRRPYSLVLTQSLARKYFGDENPVGKLINVNSNQEYTVTGIMEDIPENSHLKFDGLMSFTTLYDIRGAEDMNRWTGNINYYTYFKLKPGTDAAAFEGKLNELVDEYAGEQMRQVGGSIRIYLMPVTAIHLHSRFRYEAEPGGQLSYVYVFLAIAFLILLVSVINYTNLATARSIRRIREVGLRKVMGAGRANLVLQFITEALILSMAAFLISFFLVEWLLPLFGHLVNRNLSFSPFVQYQLFLTFLGIALLVGLVSGSYPAWFSSSFSPAGILKMEMFRGGHSNRFRNTLVVAQFFISLCLVISTLLVYRQLRYLTGKELGFNQEQVVAIPIRTPDTQSKYPGYKERLEKIPGVKIVSASQNYLGRSFSFNSFREASAPEEETNVVSTIDVDKDFVDTYEMEILQGRNFRTDEENEARSVLVNEALVKKMGWKEPVGQQIAFLGEPGYEVIGVVRDFNFSSLRNEVEPVLILHRTDRFAYLNIRLLPGQIQPAMASIEKAWKEIDPDHPVDYIFVDQAFDKLYDQDRRLGGIFVFFSVLAVLCALLGLYSLVAYAAEQRTREIGVRKVMGSTISGILALFTREFLILVGLSTLLAWPAVYFLIRKWLSGFAYQAGISIWPFLAGTFLVLVLTAVVVSSRSFLAASANPAESLRHE